MATCAIPELMVDTSVRRVLIYRLGSLGDMLIALPALHLIAQAYPEAERRLLTNVPVQSKAPAAAAVLEGTGLVHGYLCYPVGIRGLVDLLRLWWEIVCFRPQVVVYLAAARGRAAARRDLRFFRLCGVRRIFGTPLTEAMQGNYWGKRSANTEPLVSEGQVEPEAARLTRNLSVLGKAALDQAQNWSLHLSVDEHRRAAAAIGDAALAASPIAVCLGTKTQVNDWGRENWQTLLGRLARDAPGRALLLLGAREEHEAVEFAAATWCASGGGPVVNLCGRLTPRESAAAISRADLFLGHDSGPMHMAASVETPVVAVFSARNPPGQWFPFGRKHAVLYHHVSCWGCGLETCKEQRKKCILSITIDEVLTKAKDILDRNGSARLVAEIP